VHTSAPDMMRLAIPWAGVTLSVIFLVSLGGLRPAVAQSPTTQVPGPAVPADQVPPELFDAIAAYVNQNIGNYLRDCNETPLDAGPGWCSGVEKLTATTAHVGIGVDRSGIFADPINLERQPDGSWEVV